MSGLLRAPKLTEEERQRAIRIPGPTWRQYFYRDFLKMWIGLGFLVVDAWIAVFWLQPFQPLALAGSLAGAIYLEALAWNALYYRPNPDRESEHARFRPSWIRLVRFGRWTPEAERARAGKDPFEGERSTPRPEEFL
jgi:hypothetical protein